MVLREQERLYSQELLLIILIVLSSEYLGQSWFRSILEREQEWLDNFSLWLVNTLPALSLSIKSIQLEDPDLKVNEETLKCKELCCNY